MNRTTLPTATEALQDLVLQEHQRAELYKHRYELLARRTFGQSSEKLKDAPEQQLLFELPTEPEKPAPPANADASAPAKKHGGGRRSLPPELPRQRIEYTLSEEQRRCSCCTEVMRPFGEDVTEQREFIRKRPTEHVASLAVILRGGVTGWVSSGGAGGRRSGWRDGC